MLPPERIFYRMTVLYNALSMSPEPAHQAVAERMSRLFGVIGHSSANPDVAADARDDLAEAVWPGWNRESGAVWEAGVASPVLDGAATEEIQDICRGVTDWMTEQAMDLADMQDLGEVELIDDPAHEPYAYDRDLF